MPKAKPWLEIALGCREPSKGDGAARPALRKGLKAAGASQMEALCSGRSSLFIPSTKRSLLGKLSQKAQRREKVAGS